MPPPMPAGNIEQRIRASFDRQALMRTLGASLDSVADGEVRIRLPASEHIAQQHGFAHAGAIAAIADSACGYACLTRMPEDAAVLSVEFKINLLAPAAGRAFIAVGKVVRAGRTISVATAEVLAENDDGARKPIAVMQATMMRVDAPG
ncbi:MAG TPA: PaaI family thioesterase, partial [Phycisphaerales bacterium]|nr:PaaI family thioesterase [Phycisphaerales bacterium]